ncbi:DUF4013 domain-containing protein [Methanobrevibacter sp.]|uniref:DUF4013 domain-containing protein n=1 Tax=Methanobrevibacter sp. TaxID=66852 RepID=UPI00388E8787
MEIMDIIKEAFVFPSEDIGKLAIYIVLTIVVGGLAVGGAISTIFSFIDSGAYAIVGVILFILALILGFIISGYQIAIIKSGIDKSEAPEYEWKKNLIDGVYCLIISIVYFIIPAIIVLIVGFITNVPGNLQAVLQEAVVNSVNATATANTTLPAVSTVSDALIGNLAVSIAITALVALILFIIFAFIQTMAQSRLANTGSLGDALNIPEAFKDIGRIGWGKVIAVILLVIIITVVINGIIGFITNYISAIGIVSIIVTPYLIFFAYRAVGLLYSDIA